MAKKKAVTKRPALQDGKIRLEVRLEENVYDVIHEQASQAGIGVNQLISALAEWASLKLNQGEPYRESGEKPVWVKDKPKCLFLGRRCESTTEYEIKKGKWSSREDESSFANFQEYQEYLMSIEDVNTRQKATKDGIIYGILDFSPSIARGGD